MPDFKDVMEYQKEAEHHLALLDEEAPINKILVVGFEAIVHAILAVGVRLDYVLSQAKWVK